MKFSQAIDLYIADMRGEGRINSPNTARGYRDALTVHAVDVGDRDPRSTFREDVKRTLERWPNPNIRRKNRSILVSFYDWAMQELEPPRDSNPARQTRAPKVRKPQVYRMTRDEVVAFLHAGATRREQRVAFLGECAGIRNHELATCSAATSSRRGGCTSAPTSPRAVASAGCRSCPSSRRSSPRCWRASTRRPTTRPRAPGPAST